MASHLEVRRDHHSVVRTVDLPDAPLSQGEVRVVVDRVALTANNLTYALMGDALDYWSFFPAEDGWGRLPAMGFGAVTESSHPDVAEGTRLYGWFPLSSSVALSPEITPRGLIDRAAHRAGHAPIYRTYVPTDSDPMYDPDHEDLHALLRGLYLTSWLVDAKLAAEHDDLGTIVVTSASSKTALAFAHRVRTAARPARTVGITSPGRVRTVEERDVYDEVVTYADAAGLEAAGPSAIVDLAGRADVVARVHTALQDTLVASLTVGATHGSMEPATSDLAGPSPEFFFAPTEVKRQSEALGSAGYAATVAEDLRGFVAWASTWLRVVRADSPADAQAIYQRVRRGEVAADDGVVLRPNRW